MMNETVARRYGQAVFSLAQESSRVDAIGAELRMLRDALFEDEATKRFFLSPVVDRREKERIVARSFSGKASDVALHTVLLLVRKRREALLPELVRQYDKLEMQAKGLEPLTVTTARELSSSDFGELVARLQTIYGKRFDARQHVEPDLIGGLRIMMGDRRIDGSVEGRLERLSRELLSRSQ